MAMDFPNSPTVNQTYTVGDKTWKWSGTAWEIVVNRPAMRSVADTPPASPIVGDEWFNSLTGKTYTWFDSYWIEVNTNSVTGASGLNGVASASAPLSYNSTNNNISVQTDPSFTGKVTASDAVSIERSTADSWSVGFNVKKRGNGTSATAPVLNGSELGYHGFFGWDGSAYTRAAMVFASAEQNFASGAVGSGLGFYTAALNSGGVSERMRINASGHITTPAQPMFQCGPYISNMAGNAYIDLNNDVTTNVGFTLTNNTTLTVQTAGKYLVVARHLMSSTGSNYYMIHKNNVTVKHGWTSNIMIDYGVSALVECAAGDTLRLYLGNAIASQWNGAHSSLMIVKVA